MTLIDKELVSLIRNLLDHVIYPEYLTHPMADSPRRTIAGTFLKAASRLDQLNGALCLGLLAVLFCSQIGVVTLRYLFKTGFIELQDLVSYCFAAFCILAIPLAFRTDQHVRVDIFRSKQTEVGARRVDLLAIFFFLLPVFLVTLWHSLPLVGYSWSVLEGSRETGGLPGYFVVITALPLACALIVMQALAIWLDARIIHGRSES